MRLLTKKLVIMTKYYLLKFFLKIKNKRTDIREGKKQYPKKRDLILLMTKYYLKKYLYTVYN